MIGGTYRMSIGESNSNLENPGIVKSLVKFARPGFIHRNGDISLLWF